MSRNITINPLAGGQVITSAVITLNNVSKTALNGQGVTYDDVLDAHKFINNLGEDWLKYIPDDFKY